MWSRTEILGTGWILKRRHIRSWFAQDRPEDVHLILYEISGKTCFLRLFVCEICASCPHEAILFELDATLGLKTLIVREAWQTSDR